jgi:hypothetical protein
VTPAKRTGEAAQPARRSADPLLDLPGNAWPDLAAALPDEVFERIGRYLEARLSESA